MRNIPTETNSSSDDLYVKLTKVFHPNTQVRTMSKVMPTIQTQRDMRVVPFCVLRSHILHR